MISKGTINNSSILQDNNRSYDIIMTRVQNLFKRSKENLYFLEILCSYLE